MRTLRIQIRKDLLVVHSFLLDGNHQIFEPCQQVTQKDECKRQNPYYHIDTLQSKSHMLTSTNKRIGLKMIGHNRKSL
ncbi:hypothetical protein Hanom_Chr07g00606221 [Helianthus anomalus]